MTDPIVPLPPTPVLKTERLILRPLEARDVPAVQRIFPQWEVVRWLHAEVPWPYPEDGAATNYAQCVELREQGLKMFWAITLKGSDELRGRIDLWPDDGERRDMRGFWLDPDLHGQGLMMEAAEAVTGYAFEVLEWPHLWLSNAEANYGSHRIKAKQGATLIDLTPRRFVSGEAMKETWLLTRGTWLARNGRL
jgi:ribosomal-protein-alanine N-acetyltransferase